MAAGLGGGGGSSGQPAVPKILLAKPATPRSDGGVGVPGSSGAPAGTLKLMRDRDDDSAARAVRLPHGSLNLLSDSWDFAPDRFLPLLSADNTDFTVVGVIGAPGVGKSTILNELYGFDGTTSGVLPPFQVQSEETRAMARHCSVGIELRMSVERFILLDTQPVFSPSVLSDIMRPDGSSSISVVGGDLMSAELAHELMGLQLGMFLCSVCHIVLVVTEGVHDINLWRLMQTVEMLKQGISDPSISLTSSNSHAQSTGGPAISGDRDNGDSMHDEQPDFFADTVFLHTKFFSLRDQEKSFKQGLLEKGTPRGREGVISLVGEPTSATKMEVHNGAAAPLAGSNRSGSGINFFVLPMKVASEETQRQHESYSTMLKQLLEQVLSMPRHSFAKPISERDWLKSAARTWDLVKKSPVLADYSKMLQSSGLYRR
ncbi:unnamed protein product [Sphagnum jensenii]|uniref:Protein SMG9 n=1 Tax=Sphagnum jensenii TaxID=128206 RepID=A0ABP0WX91_9BRYO